MTYNTSHLFVCALMVLDDNKLRATFDCKTISMTAGEYNSISLLARNEGAYFTFDEIYNSAWKQSDGADADTEENRKAARLALEKVVQEINKAGKSFLWIERQRQKGYILRTNWGKEFDNIEYKQQHKEISQL